MTIGVGHFTGIKTYFFCSDKALTEKLRSEPHQEQEHVQEQEQQMQAHENAESVSTDFAPPSPTHPHVQRKSYVAVV